MKQKTVLKTIFMLLRLAAMAVFYFFAVHYSDLTRQAAQIVMVSLDGGGVPAKTAREIVRTQEAGLAQVSAREAEEDGAGAGIQDSFQNPDAPQNSLPVSGALSDREKPVQEGGREDARAICFWAEQADVQFSCRETGEQVQAAALFTEGNPELVAQGSGQLLWHENGCFVDNVTAEKLFGTRLANGQLLWHEDQAYTVYGTFESLRQTVVLRGDAGTEMSFPMLSLRVQDRENAGTAAEQLLMQYGLSGETMDFTFPGMLSGNFLLLLPLLLAAGLLRVLWRCMRCEPADATGQTSAAKRFCGKTVYMILILATVIFIYFLFRDCLEIPADMIPTRWSDFSFWSDWWRNQRANLLRILGSAQGEMQLGMLWNFGLSIICNIFAVAFCCSK